MAGFSHTPLKDNVGSTGSSEMTSYWGDDTQFSSFTYTFPETHLLHEKKHTVSFTLKNVGRTSDYKIFSLKCLREIVLAGAVIALRGGRKKAGRGKYKGLLCTAWHPVPVLFDGTFHRKASSHHSG